MQFFHPYRTCRDLVARIESFDELRAACREQDQGLVNGGADILLVETIFNTLNAAAAAFASDKFFEASGESLPVILSWTVTDATGRVLSGQIVSAFRGSARHRGSGALRDAGVCFPKP